MKMKVKLDFEREEKIYVKRKLKALV